VFSMCIRKTACMMGHKHYYANMNRLRKKLCLQEWTELFVKLLNQFAKSHIILDDFGLQPLDQNTRLALLQISRRLPYAENLLCSSRNPHS
ncbi:MAG: ATP-binding protein, partial [Bacteroidetes bacterium]|nr:ATP-binding protein [Bacteroidota bacterium]